MRPVAEVAKSGLCRADVSHASFVRHFPADSDARLLRARKAFIRTPATSSEILRWSAESRLSAAVGTSEPASSVPQVSVVLYFCKLPSLLLPDIPG